MEKLDRTQKSSILGSQYLGLGPPPESAPVVFILIREILLLNSLTY